MDNDNIPTLPAFIIISGTDHANGYRIHAAVWCEPCNKWHFHGPLPGHRAPHCTTDSAIKYPHGYRLEIVGIHPRYRFNGLEKHDRERIAAGAYTSRGLEVPPRWRNSDDR
jgi:hypothetical protein